MANSPNEVKVTRTELEWFMGSNIFAAFNTWAEMRRVAIQDQMTNKNKTPDLGEVRYMQGELAQLDIWVSLPGYLLERIKQQGEQNNA